MWSVLRSGPCEYESDPDSNKRSETLCLCYSWPRCPINVATRIQWSSRLSWWIGYTGMTTTSTRQHENSTLTGSEFENGTRSIMSCREWMLELMQRGGSWTRVELLYPLSWINDCLSSLSRKDQRVDRCQMLVCKPSLPKLVPVYVSLDSNQVLDGYGGGRGEMVWECGAVRTVLSIRD